MASEPPAAAEISEAAELREAAEPQAVSVALKPAGLAKSLTYWLPELLISDPHAAPIRRGTMVRVPLQGRQEQGWLVDLGVKQPVGVKLLNVNRILGLGPSPEVMDLADWAAWRWQASKSVFYSLASPPRRISRLPKPAGPRAAHPRAVGPASRAVGPASRVAGPAPAHPDDSQSFRQFFAQPKETLLQLSPTAENWSLIHTALSMGNALVLMPDNWRAERLVQFARKQGHDCVLWPQQWEAAAAGGCSVIGSRSAVFASMPELSCLLMLDEHDDNYKESRRKSAWHARDVARQRALRQGVPFVMTSPVPSLWAQKSAELVVPTAPGPVPAPTAPAPAPAPTSSGWPEIIISDLRERSHVGLFSHELTEALATATKAVCVLNRVGRVKLLACAECHNLVTCRKCSANLQQTQPEVLQCSRCSHEAPRSCPRCRSKKLKNLRVGVTKAAEDLNRLLREPVGQLTSANQQALQSRVILGTTAALRQVGKCELVAFLEFDQLLLSPHYRAQEKALAHLAQAAALVGAAGRILLQTRQPDSPVIQAATMGDPGEFLAADLALRTQLRLPPTMAVAHLSGPDSGPYIEHLVKLSQEKPGLSELSARGPDTDGSWLLSAPDHDVLLGALEAAPRQDLDLRLCVDPVDI